MEQTVKTSGTLQLEPWQKWAMDPNTPPGNPRQVWRTLWMSGLGALAASGGGQGRSPRHSTHRTAPHRVPAATTPSAEQTPETRPGHSFPRASPAFPPVMATQHPPLTYPLQTPPSFVLLCTCSDVSHSLQPMGCSPPGSSVHCDSPGKNTGVGCHFLLQLGSSQLRDQTHVFCIGRRALYH